MCKTKIGAKDFLMRGYYINKSPPEMARKIRMFVLNKTSDVGEICKSRIPYRAEVNFRLATDSVSVTVSSRRLSFFDKGWVHQKILQMYENFFKCSLIRFENSLIFR